MRLYTDKASIKVLRCLAQPCPSSLKTKRIQHAISLPLKHRFIPPSSLRDESLFAQGCSFPPIEYTTLGFPNISDRMRREGRKKGGGNAICVGPHRISYSWHAPPGFPRRQIFYGIENLINSAPSRRRLLSFFFEFP